MILSNVLNGKLFLVVFGARLQSVRAPSVPVAMRSTIVVTVPSIPVSPSAAVVPLSSTDRRSTQSLILLRGTIVNRTKYC